MKKNYSPAKKGAKKWILFSVTALVVSLMLVLCGCGAKTLECGCEKPDIKLSSLKPEEITTVEFYPTSACSKSELDNAVSVMDERLKLMGKAYEISADSEKITLKIGKEILGNSALERASTIELIKSRGNIGFGSSYGNSYTDLGVDLFETLEIESFEKNSFISDYKSDLDEDFYEMMNAADAEHFHVIKAVLTSAGKEEFDFFDKDMVYAIHDILEYNNTGEVLGVALKDSSDTYYILSTGAGYVQNPELVKYMLENKGFDIGFVSKIVDEPTWEKDSSKFGKNQVASMSGKAIVVEAKPDDYTISYTAEVDFAKHQENIKNRLDTLGVEYMFGTKGFDDKTYCIKIDPAHIGPDFVRMIFSGQDVQIRSTFDDVGGFLPSYTKLDEVDGLGIVMEAYNDAEKIKSNYNIPNGTIYLVVNNVTVATANIDDMVKIGDDDMLKFVNFTCFDSPVATESERNILNMICLIAKENHIRYDCEYTIRLYDGDNEIKDFESSDIGWKYSSMSDADIAMFNTISAFGHTVTKKIDTLNMIEITLDIPVGMNIVSDFAEEVKKVYEACGFDGGAYRTINFVIKDEKKDSPADEFRIVFKKDSYKGKMMADYLVKGPKFNDYYSQAYKYRSSDVFFTSKSY